MISPNTTGGTRMAELLLRPSVMSLSDSATLEGDLALRLEEASLPGHFIGKRLDEVRIREETGLFLLALRRGHAGAPPVYDPDPRTRLEAGDVMIVLGKPDQHDRLKGLVAT